MIIIEAMLKIVKTPLVQMQGGLDMSKVDKTPSNTKDVDKTPADEVYPVQMVDKLLFLIGARWTRPRWKDPCLFGGRWTRH